MGRTVLLTGRPGVGKTTIIKEVVRQLGGRAGGFYTAEIREGGRRQGFKIVTLDGEEGVLSHVSIKAAPRVSKYGVNLQDLEEIGVKALWQALAEADYVVVDEIGKMELFSEEFRTAVTEAIQSDKVVLGTVMATRQPWVDALKALPQVSVVLVTQDNRGKMAQRVIELLEIRRHP
jgi:nucleoside-triphosphatase